MTIKWAIYLAETLNGICILEAVMSLICLLVSALMVCCYADDREEAKKSHKDAKRIFSVTFLPGVIFALLFVLTPNKKTAYLMIGSEYISNGFESLKSSGLPEKAKLAIEKKLDEIIEGTKDE